MMFVTTLFEYVRDDWDAKVVMESVIVQELVIRIDGMLLIVFL
jgi:hypothetical protein